MKYHLKIRRDGSLEFLGAPPPGLKLADTTRTRFSEIIPVHPFRRAAFRLLRALFGEDGAVADWTRTWACAWECTILQGPQRGRTGRQWGRNGRKALVEWEHRIWRQDQSQFDK